MMAADKSAFMDGEIPEWHKGIDHVDYQPSVKALSDDYEMLRKKYDYCEELREEFSDSVLQHGVFSSTELLLWSIKESTRICEHCYSILA